MVLSIGSVRYINILVWLGGFHDKFLYLVVFSLYPSLLWKLRDKRSFFKPTYPPCPQAFGRHLIGSSSLWWGICLQRAVLGGTFDSVIKDKELYISSQACFVNSTSKGLTLSKERKSKFSFPEIVTYALALAICGIPITRSGIEVEHFLPSQCICPKELTSCIQSYFKSISAVRFVWKGYISPDFNITFVINLIHLFTISENSMLMLLTPKRF